MMLQQNFIFILNDLEITDRDIYGLYLILRLIIETKLQIQQFKKQEIFFVSQYGIETKPFELNHFALILL